METALRGAPPTQSRPATGYAERTQSQPANDDGRDSFGMWPAPAMSATSRCRANGVLAGHNSAVTRCATPG
jgi:hypothetical protein